MKKQFEVSRKARLAAAVAGAAFTASAVAQAPAEPVELAARGGEVDEIIVTSQHRRENIQRIPVTVTAVSGDAVQTQELRTLTAIAHTVPNFHISTIDNGNTAAPRFYVRGLGTNNNRGIRLSPFGVYVDGVYINSPIGQALPLFDVERIEVLRGPQGTLYGKNTIAGALNFISKQPTFENGGYFKAAYGDYGDSTFEGAIGGGLSDSVAARLAFYDSRRDSYVENVLPNGPDPEGPSDTALRLQFLFKPSAESDVTLNLHRRNIAVDGFGWILHPADPDAPRHSHKTVISSLANGRTDTWGGVLTGNVNLAGGLKLTSITAYESLEDHSEGNGGNSVGNYTETLNLADVWQVSQELRLASADTGPVTWIAGVHLFREELKSDSSTGATREGGNQGVNNTRFSNTQITQTDDSAAAFGSVTWATTERLALTFGLRYTWQEKDIDLRGIRSPVDTVISDPNWVAIGKETYSDDVFARQQEARSWSELTWDLNAQYNFSDTLRGYAKYSRGFQSGGFNTATTIDSPPTNLEPEFITNYELGIKSEWLENRVVANFAAFYYDYEDAQIFTSPQAEAGGTTTSRMLNAEKAEVYGLEAELRARFTERLSVFGNLGLLRTEYKRFSEAADQRIIGNEFSRAPKTTGTLGIDYAIPAFGGDITLGGDIRYQSLIWFNPVNQGPEHLSLAQGGHSVSNARIVYRPDSRRYQLSAFVRNLGDKEYRNIGIQTATGGAGSRAYHFGAPRTVGASVTVNF